MDHERAGVGGQLGAAVVEPLSTTTTSPSIPARSSTAPRSRTHCSMLSASLRQGMTTETLSASRRSQRVGGRGRARLCSCPIAARIVARTHANRGVEVSAAVAHAICLVYDCLFPHTVGGAERWYRGLAERLVADGHEVTYLTLRQWRAGTDPGRPG